MEVVEVRIHDGDVGHSVQADAVVGFILSLTVEPHAIEDDVIGCALS